MLVGRAFSFAFDVPKVHETPDIQTMRTSPTPPTSDAFGNLIDPSVGYARGQILRSASDELTRLQHCKRIATERLLARGSGSIGTFTGNRRDFPIRAGDASTLCEEWMGAGLIESELRAVVLEHMGGGPHDGVAVLNRTTAALIAAIALLANGRPVLAIAAAGGNAHAAAGRGCALARVPLINMDMNGPWRERLEVDRPALVIVTTVTSKLEVMRDAEIRAVTTSARAAGAIALLDDAYGARLRPVLHAGSLSLQLDAPLAVTNCDKAGLSGPRCGILAGRSDLVNAVLTQASEWGMEARAPVLAGALRALQNYTSLDLLRESAEGLALCSAVAALFDAGSVIHTDLGPLVPEEVVLREVLRRAGMDARQAPIAPCEATAAVAVVMLRDHGILTTNTHGQPGANVALRLKPTRDALAIAGGVEGVVAALSHAMDEISSALPSPPKISALLGIDIPDL